MLFRKRAEVSPEELGHSLALVFVDLYVAPLIVDFCDAVEPTSDNKAIWRFLAQSGPVDEAVLLPIAREFLLLDIVMFGRALFQQLKGSTVGHLAMQEFYQACSALVVGPLFASESQFCAEVAKADQYYLAVLTECGGDLRSMSTRMARKLYDNNAKFLKVMLVAEYLALTIPKNDEVLRARLNRVRVREPSS